MNNFQLFMKRHRFVAYGLPFMILVVGGSFGLEQFASLRYSFRQNSFLTPEQANRLGMETGQTLESEYEKMKQANIDSWQNIRVPRPYEEDFNTPR